MNSIETTTLLESIHTKDQQAIRDFRAGKIDAEKLKEINLDHVSKLFNIIEVFGYPTIKNTSHTAYKTAILIVLHSENPELLEKTASFLRKTSSNDIERGDLAYIIDKSLV